MKIDEELGYKYGKPGTLGNIGNTYAEQGDKNSNISEKGEQYKKALGYYCNAIKIIREQGNKNGLATWLGNTGNIYKDFANYNLDTTGKKIPDSKLQELNYKLQTGRALAYYSEALRTAEELGNNVEIVNQLGNIGSLYLETKKYNDAELYLKKAITLADSLNYLEASKTFEGSFSRLDSINGNFKGALEHYKKYIATSDSISNEENTKKQTRLEMQYEFDKKEAEQKAEQEVKEAKAKAEAKKQRIILLSVVGGLLLVIGFAIFIYRSLLQIKKKNIEIAEQKQKIEEKQKEILDSIRYAKRIQDAMLPRESYIDRTLRRLMKN
jgi:tetratricopeptide (TPR) repeat protein